MCPRFLHLGVALFYVLLLPTGLKQCLLCEPVGLSLRLRRGCGRQGPLGKGHGHPSLQDADHGLMCCREGADSAPHEVGRDEHPGLGGGPKAAHNAAPRHWPRGIGMGIHVAHPPTCL